MCILIGFTILAPLSFYPQLDSLKLTSLISGIMIISLVLMIFVYSLHIRAFDPCINYSDISNCVGGKYLAKANIDTLRAFPIMLFGFSCQQNTFAVVNELQMPTQSRINSIIGASILTALILYIITAYCGFATFGSYLEPDILKMYPGILLFMVLSHTWYT